MGTMDAELFDIVLLEPSLTPIETVGAIVRLQPSVAAAR
jgi:hypothetical protein